MLTNKTCDCCSNPATTHITDTSVHPPISSHCCEKHGPSEWRNHTMIRRIWQNPRDRELAMDFFAKELGVTRNEVREKLETNLHHLEDWGG